MLPRVNGVRHAREYRLELRFTDGTTSEIDLSGRIAGRGGVFRPLLPGGPLQPRYREAGSDSRASLRQGPPMTAHNRQQNDGSDNTTKMTAWVWAVHSPERLSHAVRRQLDNPKNELFLSPVSIWEVRNLVRRKRLHIKIRLGGYYYCGRHSFSSFCKG
jgi:hypothetical protein